MNIPVTAFPHWLTEWMKAAKIFLWGAADLRDFLTPQDEAGDCFPFALSFVIAMNPQIMASIQYGPNQSYADEYVKVNNSINELSQKLESEIISRGFQAKALAASERTDNIHIKGDFPHKTAATRAGLGWIGSNCQLVTHAFGPWIRLGTVFTDLELPCGPPVGRTFCGTCIRCVEACPAAALKKNEWYPGMPREEILDAQACDQWKKEHYFHYNKGHTCGICSAVCPYGLKILKQPA